MLVDNTTNAWFRTTSFNLKANLNNIKDHNLKFVFVTTKSNALYVAIEYGPIYLIIKELGYIYSYNDLYKVFSWMKDKSYLNLDMIEVSKYLINNKMFDFDHDFNELLIKAEDYQIKIKIFE